MFASPKSDGKSQWNAVVFVSSKKKRNCLTSHSVCLSLNLAFYGQPEIPPQTPPPQQSYYYKRIFMAKSGGGKNQGWEIRAKTKSNWRRKKCFAYIFTGNWFFFAALLGCQLNSVRFICSPHFICIFSGLIFFFFFKNLILEQPSLFTLMAGDYERTNKSNKYIF